MSRSGGVSDASSPSVPNRLRQRKRRALKGSLESVAGTSEPNLSDRRWVSLLSSGTFLAACVCAFSWVLVNVASRSKAESRTTRADPTPDVLVTVYSYDRPSDLLRLLEDISGRASDTGLRVAVHVVDDNSMGCTPRRVPTRNFYDSEPGLEPDKICSALGSPDFPVSFVSSVEDVGSSLYCPTQSRMRHVVSYVANRSSLGWRMYVSHYRHGRRRYWHLVSMAHRLAYCRAATAQYFVFLPDDVRLSKDFFVRATQAWDSIEHDRKMTLMLHIEESREQAAIWTDLLPEPESDEIIRIGWVESGNFICGIHFMRFFNWAFPTIPIQRWTDNPPISSGVGAVASEKLHAAGFRLFRTKRSLVAHVGITASKMNMEFRDPSKPAHLTKYFVDEDPAYHAYLEESAKVVASLASSWNREVALHAVVDSLAPQVDHIFVYLNGYDSVPQFLNVPFVTCLLSSKSVRGDIGDLGKFYWANSLQAQYHVTADDDILYPPDYVSKMLGFIKSYRPPIVVGVHGINILHENLIPTTGRRRGRGYYNSREVFMATERVPEVHNVHLLGTGTMMYRISDVGPLDIDEIFPKPNMADVWFGVFAQKKKLPLLTIPHEHDWLQDIPGTFQDSIYNKATKKRRRGDRDQTAAVRSAAPWKKYPPTLSKLS